MNTEANNVSYAPSSVSLEMWPAMPEEFRSSVVRLMSIQAYAEKIAAVGVPNWINKAPDFRARRTVARIVADEARHAFLLYRELEAVGVSEQEADALATGKDTTSSSLDGPGSLDHDDNGWIEIVMNHMFLDRAGKCMVTNFTETAYTPWAEACKKIVVDEAMHEGFGFKEFAALVARTTDREALRKSVSHWFAQGLNFFGPPPGKTQEKLARLGIKPKDNDTLRAEFRAEVVELLESIDASDLIALENDQYPYR